MATQGIHVTRNAITKVFVKWNIETWNSAFVSNLERLESDDRQEDEGDNTIIQSTDVPPRCVEEKFLELLRGIEHYPVSLSTPGLPMLCIYRRIGTPATASPDAIDRPGRKRTRQLVRRPAV